MKLLRLNGNNLEPVQEKAFKLEKEIQTLVESNLESVFDLQLIKSEFIIGGLRIDTLGYDKQAKSFVVIEYKRAQNLSVIDQGMSYLSLILNNRAEVVLEYDQRRKTSLRKDDFDWSQTRIIFVSNSFTTYQVEALNFKDLPIELWVLKRHGDSLVTLDRVNPTGSTVSLKMLGKKGGAIAKTLKEVKTYSEEDHLLHANPATASLYARFKELVLAISPDIIIKPTKVYIGFRARSNVTDVVVMNKAFKVFLNLKKGDLKDPKKLTRDISKIGHWGNGDYELMLKTEDDLEYVISLVRQSYKVNK